MFIPRNPGLPAGALLARPRGLPAELGPERRTFLFARGRMALSSAVAALGLRPGDGVLAPAYLTGSAVAPLEWAGLQVHPYPVSPATLQPNWPVVDALAGQTAPRALLVVHYFGFPCDPESARAFCDRHGLTLLEDCAHSFLTRHRGRLLGSDGDAAFYSLRKMLPIPDGGLLRLRSPGAIERLPMRAANPSLLLPLLLRHAAQALGRRPGLHRAPARPVVADEERPYEPPQGIHPWSARLLRSLDLWAVRDRRRMNYQALAQCLQGCSGIRLLRPELPEGVCPQVLPALMQDAPMIAAALQARGIGAYAWPTLPRRLAEASEAACWLAEHVLALPVHQTLDARHMAQVAEEVRGACLADGSAPQPPQP